jgi:hypothetical protein
MPPSSPAIHAALEAEDRTQLRDAAASTWRLQFEDNAWRRAPAAIASDDQHQSERTRQALEDAADALEALLSWGGRRADPDGQLLALAAAIAEVLPILLVTGEGEPGTAAG